MLTVNPQVIDMNSMFKGTSHQLVSPLTFFNVAKVTDMSHMFDQAQKALPSRVYDGSASTTDWVVSNVVHMEYLLLASLRSIAAESK